jgi:hypothetical protein
VLKMVPPTNPATFDSFKTAPCVEMWTLTLYLAVTERSRHSVPRGYVPR